MNKKKIKSAFKKTWSFIWDDDSIASWFVNIVLAFVLIKFIVYPGLGFLLGTQFPIVAVVSGSMEHKTPSVCTSYDFNGFCKSSDPSSGEICGNVVDKITFMSFDKYWNLCGNWYLDNTNITKNDFEKFRFKNGFNTGDIMILYKPAPEKIKAGDTIVFTTSTRPDPIIHRVVKVWTENGELFFATKGDHNPGINSQVNEGKISQDRYLGKAVVRVPYLGWIKIAVVKSANWFAGLTVKLFS